VISAAAVKTKKVFDVVTVNHLGPAGAKSQCESHRTPADEGAERGPRRRTVDLRPLGLWTRPEYRGAVSVLEAAAAYPREELL